MSTPRNVGLLAIVVITLPVATPVERAHAALARALIVARLDVQDNIPVLTNPPSGNKMAGDGAGTVGSGVGSTGGGRGPTGGSVGGGAMIVPCTDGGGGGGGDALGSITTWRKISDGDNGCVMVSTTTVFVISTSNSTTASTAVFTSDVEGGQDCPCGTGSDGGGGDGCVGCAGGDSGAVFSLASALVRFPLGMINERLSAGVLRFEVDVPTGNMADRALLSYEKEYFASAAACDVIRDTGGLRQILTPNLLVDIEPNSTYTYKVNFYRLAGLIDREHSNDPNSLYTPDPDSLFRYWVVSNPTGGTDPNNLRVLEYIRPDGGSPSLRARYDFNFNAGTGAWTLITRPTDSGGSALKTEELTAWASPDPNYPDRRERLYSVWNGGSALIYKERQEETKYTYAEIVDEGDPNFTADPNLTSAWRRTKRVVDPNGLQLTTEWTYHTFYLESEPNTLHLHGVVIESVKRPDGSWSWYNIEPLVEPNEPNAPNPPWMVQEIRGLGDNPDPNDPNVHSLTRIYTYDSSCSRYFLLSFEEHQAGHLVKKTTYTTACGEPPNVMTVLQYYGTGDALTSTVEWVNESDAPVEIGYLGRVTSVTHPDGRVDVYDANDVELVEGNYPNPHTYDPNGGFRQHAVIHNGDDGDPVANQSTREVRVADGEGRPWLDETYAYDGGWNLVAWTSRTFDMNGRLTQRWSSDRRYETIAYGASGCCDETRVDESGVETVVARDGLGRVTTSVRNASDQDDITTTFTYTTALQETIGVAAGGLSQTTVRKFDMAGRTTSVTSANTALTTFYLYGATAQGGRKVTAYRDYGADANDITTDVRDQITEFYRDGRIKKVSGATVIEQRYAYDQADGVRSTAMTTGPGGSTRTTTTFVDMLGRTILVERPGWSGTLENVYSYDPNSGRLLSVTSPGQAATVFGYDAMGHVEFTALDVDHSGTPDPDGADRVTRNETTIEEDGGQWWQVTRSWTYPIDSDDTAVLTGSRWVRLTGYTDDPNSLIVNEARRYDTAGNLTTSTTAINRSSDTRTETIDVPDSSQNVVRTYVGGRLMSAVSQSNVTTEYEYDALGHQVSVTDGRGNETVTAYDPNTWRVSVVTDPNGFTTTYAYFTAGEAADPNGGGYPGRLKSVTNAASKVTYFAYNQRGQTTKTWGNVPYPTKEDFDEYGQRTVLHTYQSDPNSSDPNWNTSTWPGSAGSGDQTTWTYHNPSGLVSAKTYADSTAVEYTYEADGRLKTREWARGVVTTYTYDPNTADLLDVAYTNDDPNTTDVHFTYDRLGRRDSVTDATGTRTFSYDPNTLQPLGETLDTSFFGTKVLTNLYDTSTVKGRLTNVLIGVAENDGNTYAAGYAYDTYGRLNRVTGPGLATSGSGGAWYSFDPNSDLTDKLEFKDTSGVVKGFVDWSWEPYRDLVASVENRFGPSGGSTLVSKYAYGNDGVARRTYALRSGLAFAATHQDAWGYNDRNELTTTRRYNDPNVGGTTNADPNLNRDYSYDAIGNRVTSAEGTGSPWSYARNTVNQYPAVDMPGLGARYKFDPDGNLKEVLASADINLDGNIDQDDVDMVLFCYGMNVDDPNCGMTEAERQRADISGNGTIDQDDLDAVLFYFGATVSDTLNALLAWDGENRLVQWTPRSPKNGSKKCEFRYDYMGRRVEKKAYTYSGSAWSLTTTRRFVWRDWLRLMELDGSGNVLRKWTWGRDLSGTLEGAGGIGGLLSVHDANETPGDPNDDFKYVYFYDVNGNVGQVVDLAVGDPNNTIKAKYEYDAYGNVTTSAGSYASANVIRFSTKPWDDETGMGDWGRRYYDPRLGRWTNRDPINEDGGYNLYAYVTNSPIGRIDRLGNAPCTAPPPSEPRRKPRNSFEFEKCRDEVYDQAMQECMTEPREIDKLCRAQATTLRTNCMAFANAQLAWCYAKCNTYTAGIANWACRRACDVPWVAEYAFCRDAEGGYILGCDIQIAAAWYDCNTKANRKVDEVCGIWARD